jgi:hypothetical protein
MPRDDDTSQTDETGTTAPEPDEYRTVTDSGRIAHAIRKTPL